MPRRKSSCRGQRTLDQDFALLQSLGVDEVILPSVRELYRMATASAWSRT